MIRRLLLIPLIVLICASGIQAQSGNDLPNPHDIVMLAGADYQAVIIHKTATGATVDLTGAVLYAQFRSAPGGQLFANYSTFVPDPAVGKSIMRLSRFQTRRLSGKSGVWDLLLVDGGNRATFLSGGKAAVRQTATQWP